MASKDYQIEDFRNGDRKAFTWFVDQVLPPVTNFAAALINDPETAKDIVSEAMVKIWTKRADFPSFENVKSFLYVSIRNACYDYLNSLTTRSMRRSVDVPEDLLQPDQDLMRKIIQAELIELISQEVDRLPARQAKVFRMSVMEGLQTDEICQALDLPVSAVHKAKSQAISALRVVFRRKDMNLYVIFLLLTAPNLLDN